MELVIDTNVLMHASNAEEERFVDASLMLEELADHSCCIAVDAGFDLDESRNTSLIGAEYLDKLIPGSVALALLAMMYASGRVMEVSRNPGLATSRAVNQLLRNRRDRTFLCVAIGTNTKVLVSHDYTDFQISKRRTIRKQFGVDVIEAAKARELLAS